MAKIPPVRLPFPGPTLGSCSAWHPPRKVPNNLPISTPSSEFGSGLSLTIPASTWCHLSPFYPLPPPPPPRFLPVYAPVPDSFLRHGFCPTSYVPSRLSFPWTSPPRPGHPVRSQRCVVSLVRFRTYRSPWLISLVQIPSILQYQLRPCLLHRGCLN